MDYKKRAVELHEKYHGKIETTPKVELKTKDDLSTYYTPGVAQPCLEIKNNEDDVYKYTLKSNTVAVVSDGTAVLGLGDIGPKAAIPVMEGKSILFKEFADVNAFPICLDTKDDDEIVETIKRIAPVFGGINLEDISAPRCFEIEKRLKEEIDIPVFHDDQHGTAIVVSSALINSLKLAKKKIEDVRIVINGAGSAGIAIAKMLINIGVKDIILCDINGIIDTNDEKLNSTQRELAEITNPSKVRGNLLDALDGADVFVGVSKGNILKEEHIKAMNDKSIIFAMANPTPEVLPKDAKKWGAFIVGTGRSDFDNQINNVLAFPGIFKGALEVRASEINEEMKIACVYAIANYLEPKVDEILPSILDRGVSLAVSEAVKKAAIKSGVDRI